MQFFIFQFSSTDRELPVFRKLRVSLENDFGSTAGSAKIVRLFVPYWLCNDADLPLNYRLVEIEPSGGATGDSSWLTRAAKAAKQAARRPARAGEASKSHLHKVVQSIELIEQLSGVPVMLSLQAQSDRIGGLSLANNAEGGRLSPRLGLSVTIGNNTRCNSALSFRDFEENVSFPLSIIVLYPRLSFSFILTGATTASILMYISIFYFFCGCWLLVIFTRESVPWFLDFTVIYQSCNFVKSRPLKKGPRDGGPLKFRLFCKIY